jgi:phage recombination protein Bet
VSESQVLLPESSDFEEWTMEEKAYLAAAGLWVDPKLDQNGNVKTEGHWAPRATVAAFLAHCRRTGLDPIAKQIYAIERAGKWGIQASIDGFRVVAQRSQQYAGQTPIQWTGDGKTWEDVWLSDNFPAAARAGVHRHSFVEPLLRVARWKSFAVYTDVWEDGANGRRRKTNMREPSAMWAKMPDHMLAKVAEAQALRAAFPMDLSGLYIAEEMEAEFAALEADVEPTAPLTRAKRAELPVSASEGSGAVSTPGEAESPSDQGSAPAEGDTEPTEPCERCGHETAVTELAALPDVGLCDSCTAELEAEDERDRARDRMESKPRGAGRG